MKMKIKKQALSLIEKYCTNDPFKLCEFLNIAVEYAELGNMRGYYYQNENGSIIMLDSRLNEHIQKFVCAHEIGHYVLHDGMNRVFLSDSTLLNAAKYEREANEFSMCILFPDDEEFLSLGDTIHKISVVTGISEPLIQLRAKNIDKGEW